MGLFGILLGLALLMWLAYRGWSVLLVSPLAALVAAAVSGEPLLAHWTLTFMNGAARFFIQWFPMFLLGGLFGKLMDDSRSISSIANFLTERLGTRNTMLSVVLASALVTYGGVSVFVAFFVLVPMATKMFQAAGYSEAVVACNHRSWCIYVYDVRPSRLTVGQQRHSDAVLWDNNICGSRYRDHCVGDHLRVWNVVAPTFRSGRADCGRGLWRRFGLYPRH
jgi:hypothetical protein